MKIAQTKDFSDICDRILNHDLSGARTGSHGFAVFCFKNGAIKAEHLTDRRLEILNKDLSIPGPIRDYYVGCYNKDMLPSHLLADIEYVMGEYCV